MSQPSMIDSHEGVALGLTPAQFQEKPVYEAFIKTWMDELQEVEDVFYNGLFLDHLYYQMSGFTLDKFGHLFNLTRAFGESDDELRRRIVGEIMKRSSDGTPDRIREILEALIPIKNLRIFEHCPSALLVYGYTTIDNFKLGGSEALFLKDASPVGTGSCVFGFVEGNDESKLFIPSEIIVKLKQLVAHAPDTIGGDPATDPLVDWNMVAPDGGGGFNNLVVRDVEYATSSVATIGESSSQAILPEIGYRQERFQVDNADSTIEDFSVDTTSGIEGFYIDKEGVENDKGIMLEMVQVSIDEYPREPIGTYP